MSTPTAALEVRCHAISSPVRLLHAWHLLSLDAPTVAFCWTLLFARAGRVQHPLSQAFVLACAVWLIYVADRILDAGKSCLLASQFNSSSNLSRMYRHHAKKFAQVGLAVSIGMVPLLLALPRTLLEAWLLLAVPLLGYAVAVHLLGLAPHWKSICVGVFFSTAAALPVAILAGIHWPLWVAALLFACVCIANCVALSSDRWRVRWLHAGCASISSLTVVFSDFGRISVASVLALLLLQYVQQRRTEMEPLTYRALADAALVVPALVLLAY